MIRTRGVRTATAAAGIALAALTFGSIPQALAQPGDAGCSSMAMPAGQADADAGNALTRAGQVNAATAPRADGGGQDPMTCTQVGHG